MQYNYLESFIESNKTKSFVTNLQKYTELDFYGRAKTVSSFLTHLLISQEHGQDNADYVQQVLSLLNEMILYKQDNFLNWLESNLK